ncbi:GNAT family N-acetyltransferase [Cellvibrio sp.]
MPLIDPALLSTDDTPFVLQPVEPERFALVDRFYRAQGYKVKCAVNERIYAIADNDEGFIAAARLVPQSSGHYWLRNLLVASHWRGHGIATRLIQNVLPDLAPHGCYCFALPHLTGFYTALGFAHNPSHCPEDILRTYNTYRTRGRDWVLMGYIQG